MAAAPTPTAVAAEGAKKGGRLRIAHSIAGPNETNDPAKMSFYSDASRAFSIFNRVVAMSPELKPEPELAESWEPNQTGDEWVFKLRKGVQFHDGSDFTANDVIYTVRRLMDPATASPAAAFFADIDLQQLRADDPYTLRIKLLRPNADLPIVFADYHAQIMKDGTTSFDTQIGTGAFKFKTLTPGERYLVERNPNYWKSGLPYLDEIEGIDVTDPVARMNALQTGEVDLIESVDLAAVDQLKSKSGIEVLATHSGFHITLPMLVDQAPYTDNNVRTAMKLVVDRKKWVDTVLKGYGVVGNDTSVWPGDPFYADDIPIREYDPEQAKSLLKKAGMDSLTVELHTSEAFSGMLEAALVYKEMAAAGGIDVTVKRDPVDSYYDAIWMKVPFCVAGWNTRPSADVMLSTAYRSDAAWNESHWKRPEFDKLLLEARGTVDFARRKEIYREMQRMIRDDGGVIIPAFSDLLDAGATRVKGLKLHPQGPLGQWHFEGVWLE
jgi:peptide/nickel transport system substrate-binding protein